MATSWLLADVHRGHKNIHTYRNFASNEEHDSIIKENYHNVVTKRDIVFFLGDIAFTHEALAEIKTWTAAKKVLIVGNHDLERGIKMRDLCDTYDEVYAFRRYKEFWLSHPPMHPDELRGKVNVHGHVHDKTIDDPRYFNVSMENIDMTPINLEVLRERLYHQSNNQPNHYRYC